jgi:uncharacterized MAPEG superfamily protein
MPMEFKLLVFMTIFFLLAWLPGSIAKWQTFGGAWLGSNREPIPGRELSGWGARAERAYSNLKDYYPGFLVGILLLGILNKFDSSTSWAAGLYVTGRLGHFMSYSLGLVLPRALCYFLAMGANLYLLIKVIL